METILLVVQVILALGIIGLVLIQRTDQDSLGGLGGGSGLGVVSGRAKANFFTRLTAIMAALFMLNSMALTIIVSRSGASSIIDKVEGSQPKEVTVPIADKPTEEGAPADAAKDIEPATDENTEEKTVSPEEAPAAESTAPEEKNTETDKNAAPADEKQQEKPESAEPETIEVPKAQ